MWFNLAWRLFRHEMRRGELTIILAAIVLSVAAVMSLSLFSERLQTALVERSSQFIAADRVVGGRNPLPQEWRQKAIELELNTAQTTYLQSMVFANDTMTLADIRAVNENYPLKGDIKVTDVPFGVGEVIKEVPGEGETWVESQVFQTLGLSIGDVLEVGDKPFTITRVLSEVPDAGFSIFNSNPKVMILQEELEGTGILGEGSRAWYDLYLTGDSDALSDYADWLLPLMDSDLHYTRSIEDDDSWVGNRVKRAEQYFLLASLLAIVLASVAIAVAAQRYSQRHYDPVAIMKTLGASRKMVQQVFLLQIIFITLLGIIIGGALGYGIQAAVASAIQERVAVSLQSWYWGPVWIAIFTGVVCALLFSLYPLLKLFSVPPLRVLRKDLGANMSSRVVQFLAAGGAIFALMWAYSQNLKISAILFVSGIVLVAALLVVTYGLIWLGRRLGKGRMGAWQLAWARIQRRSMDNSVQLISFSVTIMLLLVVLVMRNDMIQQWRDQLPQGTPNYFMANITEAQKPVMEAHFAQRDVQTETFYPVVRARFVAVNGERVNTQITKEDEETEAQSNRRDAFGREANLTWSNQLQNQNTIVAGQWFGDYQEGQPYGMSVEARTAERMDLNMGDVVTFNIGSEVVEVTITSIREVNWQTMQPNFFFVLQPEAMENFRPTYITSFNLDTERKDEIGQLMAPFSTVTLFDVDARINQLREIVDQVSMAVEFILVLVLIAGALVLIAQVQASMDERQQELAILRTLGAKGLLIRASVVLEFIIIGVVAGVMAALANELTLYLLQSQIFEMKGSLHYEYWVIAPIVGAAVVGILGAISCWRLLSLNTSQLLRNMV
ncbi:ABC transporter permease [Planctobacterium marinum]|uniref:ABC transporter permease n=1 Tax=Planctobacterium marinum TaxID=1631968 RepID=A0AA48HIZ0_9ALTE|nr:ABC transporter permease [Planctobacterium marinum]